MSQATEIKEVADLPALVMDSVELFKMTARQAKLNIEIDTVKLTGNREWLGYPGYLTQVLVNLLQNIERYAYPNGQDGRVEISVVDRNGPRDEQFAITVRDFGQGISSENLAKIFDPFFTTGRGQGGTGLGLAIIHTIVTSVLKGTVAVKSELGKGTAFSVAFPKIIPEQVQGGEGVDPVTGKSIPGNSLAF